ncbi:MAG TPA: TAT-variant-translocated molybdopterin oxidoreductase [Phycisphaerae bacterium]|nr:TAT-variant-translocated molybdopterin oxidoreductase [Phycisphaerae bacterium]
MPSMNGEKSKGKLYWRSLDELADKPEFRAFVEREFPAHASEWFGGSRRAFLKVMGASMALAGLASCRRWPEENLAPYAHRPVNRMDGVPVHYASAYELGGMGHGVVAVSYDGRPIKVDGNPSHPLTGHSGDIFLQASVLNVWDPDRSRSIQARTTQQGTEAKTWQDFTSYVKTRVKPNGQGIVFLTEASRSPTVAALRKRFGAAKWFEWEPISSDNQRAGAKAAFGRPLRAVPRLDAAEVIVSIDADLFHAEPLNIKFNADWAKGRLLRDNEQHANAKMNRLYVVESGFTITGSSADHRRAVRPSQIPGIVAAIAAALGQGNANVATLDKELQTFINAVAADVKANAGKAVFVAGTRQNPDVHAAVAAINSAINAPVDYYADPEDPRVESDWTPHAEQIKAFAQAAASAELIVVIGANPVLTAPRDLKIEDILSSHSAIHLGQYVDETARECLWHVPQAHYLEAWGDVRTFDGTVSIAQPLIEPLFGGKSTIEFLSALSGDDEAGYDLVRATAREYIPGYSDWTWKQALFNGVVANSARPAEKLTPNVANLTAAISRVATTPASGPAGGGGYELALHAGMLYDGRFANNGWLMELPDPMNRCTWDNPLLVSPNTAKKLNVDSDQVLKLSANGQDIEATVYILPGQPDDVLGLAVGYGRKGLGSIAHDVGSDGYALKGTKDGSFIPVQVGYTGKVNPLACVQQHHMMDLIPGLGKQRIKEEVPGLVVEGTLDDYRKHASMGTRKVVSLSMFNERSYDHVHKWGMAIDLTVCTGCSACVVACTSENNVPVVGKAQVYKGREMHWIRIDRYFKHDEENPQAVHQPVTCMHCENAPCEEVCPVAATTHSVEGLNMMTYNRCIGTRYCSNNCPYKVRRFNFFDYNNGEISNQYTPNILRPDIDDLLKMSKNPQVTVRMRGVMEKCTYCVQRIENARIKVRAENRDHADTVMIPEGMVVTACQQACPTNAIVFGNLNDPNARVTKLHALAQVYGLLDPELNTKPRTQYLAKVRNPASGVDPEWYNDTEWRSEGFFFEEDEGASEKESPAGTQRGEGKAP